MARVRAVSRPGPIAFFYLAFFALSEVITVLVNPLGGEAFHLLALFMLILHTTIVWGLPLGSFTLSLAFVPLIRVISLSLPMTGIPLVFWYLIVSIPLFAAAIAALKLLAIPVRVRVLKGQDAFVQIAFGLTGFLFGTIEYMILQPEPLIRIYTLERLLLAAAILLISTGLLEEIIFRGIMQDTSIEQLGRVLGIIYVALIFAVLHIGFHSVSDIIFVFLIGLFFGWFVARTGNLLGVTLSHALTNIVFFLAIPYWIFSGGGEAIAKAGEVLPENLFGDNIPNEIVEMFESRFLVTREGRGHPLPDVMNPLPPPVLAITRPSGPQSGGESAQLSAQTAKVKPIDTLKNRTSLVPAAQEEDPLVSTGTLNDDWAGFCGTVPAGWSTYTVRWGDTLSQLAYSLGTTVQQIVEVNCLDEGVFYAGMQINLPPAAVGGIGQDLTVYSAVSWYITSPAAGSAVANTAAITGTADFDPSKIAGYRLEVQRADLSDSGWLTLDPVAAAPVINGQLGLLRIEEFSQGDYFLRLVLVANNGSTFGQPYSINVKIK